MRPSRKTPILHALIAATLLLAACDLTPAPTPTPIAITTPTPLPTLPTLPTPPIPSPTSPAPTSTRSAPSPTPSLPPPPTPDLGPLTPAWEYTVEGVIIGGPAHDDSGTVYFPVQDGDLVALDIATGAEKWRKSFPATLTSAPAVGGGTLYLAVTFREPRVGAILALDSRDGAELWSFETEGEPSTSPIIAGDLVIVGDSAGVLYAVDAQSGEERWRYAAEDVISAGIVIEGSTLYTGDLAGNLLALDVITGSRNWIQRTPRPNRFEPAPIYGPALSGDKAIFAAQTIAAVYAVDTRTGRIRWDFDATTLGTPPPRLSPGARFAALATCPPATWGDTVYACISFGELGGPGPDRHGFLYALDAQTGAVKWRFEATNEIYSRPIMHNGALVFASKHGVVHALHPDMGAQLWAFPSDGPLHNSLLSAADTLLFGTWAGTFYGLR